MSSSTTFHVWGCRALIGIGVVGLAFVLTENIFPSMRPQSAAQSEAQYLCSKLLPKMTVDELKGAVGSANRQLSGVDDHVFVRFESGCVCSIELSQGSVSSAKALCNS